MTKLKAADQLAVHTLDELNHLCSEMRFTKDARLWVHYNNIKSTIEALGTRLVASRGIVEDLRKQLTASQVNASREKWYRGWRNYRSFTSFQHEDAVYRGPAIYHDVYEWRIFGNQRLIPQSVKLRAKLHLYRLRKWEEEKLARNQANTVMFLTDKGVKMSFVPTHSVLPKREARPICFGSEPSPQAQAENDCRTCSHLRQCVLKGEF